MTDPKTRIYLVTNGENKRLVRATSNAAALRHAAKTSMSVRLATQEDCLEMAMAGVKVEEASAVDADVE